MPRRERFPRTVGTLQVVSLTCLLLSAIGCGGEDWQADTYPARGSISINGEPPEGAVVELHATGEQPDLRHSRPWGVVDQQGEFTLSTYRTGDGAPPGEYRVTVRWPPDVSQPSLADRLNGRYNDPQSSEFLVTIDEGDNELAKIEIEGARVETKDRAGASGRQPPGPGMQPK